MSKSRRSNRRRGNTRRSNRRRANTRRNRRNRRNVTRRGGFLSRFFKKSPAAVAAPAVVETAVVKTRNNRVRNAAVFVNAEMAKGKQPYHIYMNVRNNGGPHLPSNVKNAIAAKGVNVSGWI